MERYIRYRLYSGLNCLTIYYYAPTINFDLKLQTRNNLISLNRLFRYLVAMLFFKATIVLTKSKCNQKNRTNAIATQIKGLCLTLEPFPVAHVF